MNPLTSAPILIIGCRRSGTTLLRTMLFTHPDLLVHPKEPQFILTHLSRYGYTLHHKEKAIAELLKHPYLPETINHSDLATALADPSVQTWADFFLAYLKFWAGENNAHRQIVLKDPAFTFHLDALQIIFPQSRFIHVVRHPYGNVSSQRARWPNASIWECASLWRDAVTIGHQLTVEQPQRCLEIDYQELVLEPEITLKKVCQFLTIPFNEGMLHFSLDTISFTPGQPPKPKRFTGLDPARLERWRSFLTPLDIRLIEQRCKPEMHWWEYKILNPPVELSKLRWRLFLERLHYSLLKNGRSLKQFLCTFKNRINP